VGEGEGGTARHRGSGGVPVAPARCAVQDLRHPFPAAFKAAPLPDARTLTEPEAQRLAREMADAVRQRQATAGPWRWRRDAAARDPQVTIPGGYK
jgi:hypothetical protein